MTVILLGTTIYISTLLTSPQSPTQIQKTKAAAVTYTRKVDLFPTGITSDGSGGSITPTAPISSTISPTPVASLPSQAAPTKIPTLIAKAQISPSIAPTKSSSMPPPSATAVPTSKLLPTLSPTTQPLLAYKSTTLSPTVISTTPINTAANPTASPLPTKKIQPTGVQQLPDTGWIQISSILFIVATSTILFSLLF